MQILAWRTEKKESIGRGTNAEAKK